MPKAELHLHLDGSLRIDTALELARTRGVEAPSDVRRDARRARRARAGRGPGAAPARLRPADRAHAGRRGARADGRRPRRGQGRARTSATSRSGGRRCSTPTAASTGRQVVEATWRGGARDGATARDRGPADRDAPALARARGEPRVRRRHGRARDPATGSSPWTSPGQEARFPDPELHRGGDRRAPAPSGSTSRSTPASGAARPRSGAALAVDPERIAHGPLAIDDPSLVAELIRRGTWLDLCPTSNTQASIVPTSPPTRSGGSPRPASG